MDTRATATGRPRAYRRAYGRASLWLGLVAAGCGGDGGNAVLRPPDTMTVAMVEIAPGPQTLNVGERVRFTATARTAGGAVVNTAVISWSSNAPQVAQVTGDGTVVAVSKGNASITATVGDHAAMVSITIVATYDLDALGVPRLITHSYIDLDRIQRVSRFRSGIGHDYSDGVEHCRSMKHYFQPRHDTDWGTVTISAPVDGTIVRIDREQTLGSQVRIEARAEPSATVVLFHVKLDSGRAVGEPVSSGMRLGTHVGSATMSDVAVELDTPSGRRLISYFDAMTDSTLAAYQARGVASRSEWSISASERNAFPLSCDGESFRDEGTIPNWVELR